MVKRICKICNENKNMDEFRKKVINSKTRYEWQCKKCVYQRRKQKIKNMKKDNPTKYDEIINKRKERDKKYYEKNKRKINQRNNKYYEKNKNEIQKYRRKFRKENPERVKKWKNSYRDSIEGKLAMNYRRRVRREIKSGEKWLELLDCSIAHLKKWFEFNFDMDHHKNFTWKNYGRVWTIDHVMPCHSFDMTDDDQVKQCFNWKNTIPVTKKYNEEKINKIKQMDLIKLEIRLKLFSDQFNEQ